MALMLPAQFIGVQAEQQCRYTMMNSSCSSSLSVEVAAGFTATIHVLRL
jgi:hypothetical protein